MSNPFAEEQGPQPPKVLKAAMEVLANLRPLLDNHTPLTIRFSDRNQRFQTFLVELDREKGTLALDELIPNDGDRYLANGELFTVEGYHEGARISWQSNHPAKIAQLDGVRCYRSTLPSEIIYHQRRNAFRAQIIGPAISATLGGKRLAVELQGRLIDISATGCKLSLPGNHVDGLQSGQVYERLQANLPVGDLLIAAELRHARYDEKRDQTVCGIRFHQMSGLLQRQVERYVYQLQRDARRLHVEASAI